MIYNVIDIDPAMDYAPGEEVLGEVMADSANAAIAAFIKDGPIPGLHQLQAFDPQGFAEYILPTLQAIPKAE